MTIHSILGTLIPVFMFRALVYRFAMRKNNKVLQFLYDIADYADAEKSEVLLMNHYYGCRQAIIKRGLNNDA